MYIPFDHRCPFCPLVAWLIEAFNKPLTKPQGNDDADGIQTGPAQSYFWPIWDILLMGVIPSFHRTGGLCSLLFIQKLGQRITVQGKIETGSHRLHGAGRLKPPFIPQMSQLCRSIYEKHGAYGEAPWNFGKIRGFRWRLPLKPIFFYTGRSHQPWVPLKIPRLTIMLPMTFTPQLSFYHVIPPFSDTEK